MTENLKRGFMYVRYEVLRCDYEYCIMTRDAM